MKIFVTLKPNSRKEVIERIDATHFKIHTKSPPREGRANAMAIHALAYYLDIPKSRIKICAGAKLKQKILEIF
ncbi:MAG: hypothetical protein G01um101466_652 [Parcubacteria group bacterium Gr01-1014_66]|nr:MAG: hypothetical protein G01um101466_652 [Parcubacteria group bacterium Gr01-1014_66]